MKIETMSILCGSTICNGNCPFCISRMTPKQGMKKTLAPVNWRNLDKAARYAQNSGVSTILETGKGEPTLFPDQLTEFLEHLEPYKFPFNELQTNGIRFQQDRAEFENYLAKWYKLGMTTVALSIVHYEDRKNQEIYTPGRPYPNLEQTIKMVHDAGLSVRLNCMMARGFIDDIPSIERLVEYAHDNKAEQINIRRVVHPENSEDPEAAQWVTDHYIENGEIDAMRIHLDDKGHRLMVLPHGAIVYDWKGQNICLNNCLTLDPQGEIIRQLIFFPDGHLRYDWQYEGAILL